MIFIFSENVSYSARHVARYLLKEKQSFEVFLETDKIDFCYNLNSSGNQISILKNGQFLCSYTDLKSVWAHRSEINIEKKQYSKLERKELSYVKRHEDTQVKSIRNLLHKKKCLGRFGKLNFNKIIFLNACQELEIRIPKTLITRKKDDLIPFFSEQRNGVIVKSIAENFHHCVSISQHEQIWQHGTTNLLDEVKLKKIPEEFDLSLFQEKLDKKYELRVFYLDGICFPQIIFSQKHSFSEVDYRLGLGESEMRQGNFNLPMNVQGQIKDLMNSLDLNVGCIDIVVTKQDEYVFLEVNPSGIFTDMVGNCNYDIHYEIAKYLML
ncbi:hypothetical protein [Fluviicola chungangensis]|uniref:Grasp-with-spasm system ATP-grasp peptide maturase n=1 Tax=Fluviicola chungangensis TaxID=2597671 RepID=A0A556MMN5_9FLAO|nr:hypothetical protein [Fluviicola chungangensis]TSJ41156.1 hypothetical protein FO442_14685 [Fluviicola chungangensis]